MNINIKKRLFAIISFSLAGFITISFVAFLTNVDMFSMLLVNAVFILILAFISYKSMVTILGGIDVLKEYLDNLMDFVFFRTNAMVKVDYRNKDDFSIILSELDKHIVKFSDMRKTDMHVLGEVVIALTKVSQGTYNSEIYTKSDNFMISALRKVTNQMLKNTNTNMEELINIVELYSQQDYTKQMQISKILRGNMRLTMERINQLGSELNSSAKQNLQNGNLLEENSIMMNKSVESLVSKAYSQAASLKDSSDSLEEITSITKNNTQNTSKMADLSKDIKKTIMVGEELANNTASSMDEINAKVKAINEAILVIDEIAFQTNILSLNAAVEAATAGEAGKGFTVVAGEVRNLANRSAEAAKEIKNLVDDALTKADYGKKVSDDMRVGYENLNSLISETINIIQDVNSASTEQLNKILEVNSIISILDKVTQENTLEANNVASITSETLKMAHLLVEDAKSKKVI